MGSQNSLWRARAEITARTGSKMHRTIDLERSERPTIVKNPRVFDPPPRLSRTACPRLGRIGSLLDSLSLDNIRHPLQEAKFALRPVFVPVDK